jgi:predicted site-specific integrase-resolvase
MQVNTQGRGEKAMAQPNVTTIPAKKSFMASAGQATNLPVKRRVAGYARVSTDKEEQENSFEAQVRYYTEYIQSRPDWEYISVYTDDGISATNTKKRDGFNQMVADALAGKLDLIVTKSVSRFARNTVDSLQTVRELKEKGVEIFFEKEQIWTFDGKGELLITIMSSLAQEGYSYVITCVITRISLKFDNIHAQLVPRGILLRNNVRDNPIFSQFRQHLI